MKTTAVIFIVAGVLAIAFPHFTGLALEIFYGVLLLCLGLIYLITTIKYITGPRAIHFAISFIFLATGALLLAHPLIGLSVLTVLIGASFIINGAIQTAHAFSAKSEKTPMLFGGIFSIIAGGLILLQFPSSADWVVGLIVGLNLIVIGLVLRSFKIVPISVATEE